jgi:hypothetical protein
MLMLRKDSLFILNPELLLNGLYTDFKHNINKLKTKIALSFLSFYLSKMNNLLDKKSIGFEKMLDNNNIKKMTSLNLDKEYDLLYRFRDLYEDYEILKRYKGRNKNFDIVLEKLDIFLDNLSKNINYLGYIESKLLTA